MDITKTENGEVAYTTSDDLSLDFFTTVVRGSSVRTVVEKFGKAFNENPETALKVLYNFRDVRGGKGERLITYVALFWLKCTHNDTYRSIVREICVDYGCWKDILFLCDLTKRYSDAYPSGVLNNEFELNLLVEQWNCDVHNDAPSLFVKWAPMERRRYHSVYAKLVEKLGVSPRQYRIQLVAAKKRLNLVETNMSNGGESSINFGAVPSACHRINRKAFSRNVNAKKVFKADRDKLAERYKEYLEKVKEGEAKINSKGTQPHQIVGKYLSGESHCPTLEAQWKAMVADISKGGKFDRSLAVVDVSGSMEGQPMEVAIALGILTAECTSPPFSNQVITFSSDPTLQRITGGTLHEKVRQLKRMDWSMSTNIEKVFTLILKVAVDAALAPDKMVERLFIFTDMQFDSLKSSNDTGSTFAKLGRMYESKGYILPQIVCWNLRDSMCVPAKGGEESVCMLSGFSGELLKAIMQTTGKVNSDIVFRIITDPYNPKWVPSEESGSVDVETLAEAVEACKIKGKK